MARSVVGAGVKIINAGVTGSADSRRSLRYARSMRYPEGGGLTAEERARRERVRLPRRSGSSRAPVTGRSRPGFG